MCPECGEEYLPTVVQCVHCRVALVAPGGTAPDAPSQVELPPVAQLVCIRTSSLDWAQGLSERLSEAGITHRLEAQPTSREGEQNARRPDSMPYGVYVLERDAADAREIDQEHMRSQIPDLPEEGVSEAAGEGCPACGAAVAADAAECPECGLALLEG
ncbi:MAG TPA: hypothetical protein VFY49_04260 [Myxococcota bacterium]|nr:hypothetical protein [Myxococcota bacterium]